MTSYYFTWLAQEPSAQELDLCMSRGVLPLVQPEDDDRRTRWQKVLRWYGGREVNAHRLANLPVVPLTSSSQGHHFKSLGRGVQGVVRLLVRLDAAAALPAGVFGGPYRTAQPSVVVGTAACFTHKVVERLSHRRGAMVVALDVAALYFLVAKIAMHLRAPRQGGLGFVSDLDGVVRSADSLSAPRRMTDGHVRRALASSRSTLILAAHGEGGHAKLGETVVCGRIREHEQGAQGAVHGGCSGSSRALGDPLLQCKRATPATREIALFSEIRATEVILLTCNGFTTAGELYPSDVSAVMALVDGYAASVLTTHTAMQFTADVAREVYDGWICGANHVAALLCAGDRGPAPGLAFSWLGASAALASVFEALPRDPPQRRPSGTGRGQVYGVGRHHDLLRLKQRFELIKTVLWRIGPKTYRSSLVAREQLDEFLLGIQPLFAFPDIELERERGIQLALRGAEILIEGLLSACIRQMGADADLRNVPEAMMSAFPELIKEHRTGDICTRCQTVLRTREFGTGEREALGLREVTCPICGLVSITIGQDESPKIVVQGVGLHFAGAPLTVSVCHENAPFMAGLLAIELSDKANGQTVSSTVFSPCMSTSLTLPTPPTMSPDIHTIRVLWCKGARMGFARTRVAFAHSAHSLRSSPSSSKVGQPTSQKT